MIENFLQKLRGGPKFLAPCPERPLAVIGDVHGCHDLLIRLIEQLPQGAQIVLVGDYIDRGEQSAQVLRYLQQRQDLVCLRGNHEDMLLQFLWVPERYGPRWLQYGGLQTLAAFRIPAVTLNMDKKAFIACRDALVAEMGEDLIAWLQRLPTSYQSGNVFVAHAGAHPKIPLAYQDPAHLVWGHPEFKATCRDDGIWVAYGHVIQDKASAACGRIAVDTGAYATGVLTAAYIAPGKPLQFISAIQ